MCPRLVGESAFILAIAAIYLTTLDDFKLAVPEEMYIVVILYCALYALFQV